MKKVFFSMALLLSISAFAQEPCHIPLPGTCPSIGDPIISTCFADMEKVLARSMTMANVSKLNGNNFWPDGSSGTFNCNDPVATSTFTGFPNDLRCDIGGKSPQRYCEDISWAAFLNATLLTDVAVAFDGFYSNFGNFGNTNFMQSAAQAVIDINALYDCAGHRRPVIGCSILENVDHSVDSVTIPLTVINAFSETILANPDLQQYYWTPGRMFFQPNICPPGDNHPDISKLEARMFFYYLATLYIDRGYKQINPDYISYSVLHHGTDPTGYYTYDVLSKVRAYAASKGSMLIIPSYLPSANFYYGTNLLFDYRFSALRPQEVNPISGHPGFTCSKVLVDDQNEAAYWQSTGTAPYSNCYYGDHSVYSEYRMPFLTGLDWHNGTCNGGPYLPMSTYTGDRSCVWGYDEARFFHSLSNSCQANFADYAYEAMRGISHRGFFSMPNRLICKNGDFHLNPLYTDPSVNGAYRMANNSSLVNRIANDIWHVDQSPSFTVTPLGCLAGMNAYLVSVNNPEQSTVYTWHVQMPGGSWLPYTYGTARIIFPVAGTGTYNIGLRCDNWGYTSVPLTGVLTTQQTPTLVQYFCRMSTQQDKDKIAQLEARVNSSADLKDAMDILKEYESDTSTKPLSIEYLRGNGGSEQLLVFPNPAKNTINVRLLDHNSEADIIRVVNTIGIEVQRLSLQVNTNNYTLNVAELPRGLYYLYVADKKGHNIATQKITLN